MTENHTIQRELEKARRQLLDLTARNRLLSIPQHDRAKLIRVADELSDEVLRLLVRENKRFTFLEKPKTESTALAKEEKNYVLPQPDETDEGDLDDRGVSARHRDSKLQTTLTSEMLQRRLLSFYLDARTAIEEQGVNTLYLAIGQLKWHDDRTSDVERFAPLLLVPVELQRSSARDRFRLKALDQEPSDNLSLVAKLREFGIHAPEFNWDEDFLPTEYFKSMAEVVSKQDGWEVLPNKIVLGFFSFAKFLMYRDLDPVNWPGERRLDAHELVCGLIGEGFPASESRFPDDANLDELVPVERLNHVVDSDSSQALAIEEVRSNGNLVIQGPPGTGKSQTITNLISTAVLDGKRVLFVAEKLAALEVVRRRLEAIGLGPLVLELHSHKANKRVVLEDLKKTLALGRPKSKKQQQLLDQLARLRQTLNDHASRLNEPLQPCELTAIKIIGHLTMLEGACSIEKLPQLATPETWTPAQRIEREQLIADIMGRVEAMGDLTTHPWRGVERSVLTVFDAEEIQRDIEELATAFADLKPCAEVLAEALNMPPSNTLNDIEHQIRLAQFVSEAPGLDKTAITHADWEEGVDRLNELIAAGREFARLREDYADRVIDAAWSTDLTQTRLHIAAHGGSLFRFLNGRYRNAMAEFRSILKSPPLPKGLEARLAWLDDLMAARKHEQAINKNSALAESCFGRLWEGVRSDWEQLETIVNWVRSARKAELGAGFFTMFAGIESTENCDAARVAAAAGLETTTNRLTRVTESLSLNCETAFGLSDVSAVPLEEWTTRLGHWKSNPEALSNWVTYQQRVEQAQSMGIGGITDALLVGDLEAGQARVTFDLAYYRQMYRRVIEQFPELARFDGQSHDMLVDEFRESDHKRIELARYETLTKHHESMPRGGGMGAVGLLKGEMNKKRGHMAIRQLLQKTGTATQAIKPVFMMSPLSVAQFLEPGAMEFDLVIFDEASQVEPVDAIGAIARGKQLVVVGDEHQLPPTRFFTSLGLEEDNPDADEADENIVSAGDIESILGLAHTKGLRSKMLRWHYRSRHQSLIRVSNHEFYDNNLFIIPSPQSGDPNLGLKFHHVENGVFDRGKTYTNIEEARAVAKAVIQHATDQPNRSLGVAAFSVSQRDAIIDALELLRNEHPELEPFFNQHPHEPFFVKNLENVQGDERDVMLISVGYARDPKGFFAMNFGPLNRDGGERRLNVLISRAKERCEVYASIRAEDIDLDRSAARGVAALKTFLQFAENGILGGGAPETDRSLESPFEESVKQAIEAQGYAVQPQVGGSGFFVDLAVVHPEKPGRFVLGIECDGASYHSARSARERDRQRQAVLEDHGWIIHRIWSTDWFQRPREQLTKVLQAIEDAGSGVRGVDQRIASGTPPARIERGETIEMDDDDGLAGEPYQEADFKVDTSKDMHELKPAQLAKIAMKVIKVEAPVHLDEVVSRLREAWGLGRAGRRVQEAIDNAIGHLVERKEILVNEEFISLPDGEVVVRDRDAVQSSTLKTPEHLPPTEVRRAITRLLEENHGVEHEPVAVGVARMFGFKSTSQQLRRVIEEEIVRMHDEGRIVVDGELLKLSS